MILQLPLLICLNKTNTSFIYIFILIVVVFLSVQEGQIPVPAPRCLAATVHNFYSKFNYSIIRPYSSCLWYCLSILYGSVGVTFATENVLFFLTDSVGSFNV